MTNPYLQQTALQGSLWRKGRQTDKKKTYRWNQCLGRQEKRSSEFKWNVSRNKNTGLLVHLLVLQSDREIHMGLPLPS